MSITLAGLAPGTYRVDVELDGFRPVRRQGIRVETGETVRLDFELAVGGLSETRDRHGDAPLQRATASLGQVVSQEKVTALPLNGRSFITLAALAPGVALPPGSQLPRINGGRPRTNEYLFDGISVLQPEPGQVAFFPMVDAIQEFKIETNSPPAEFGRFNGGVINLTTKSGSNALHGTRLRVLPARGAERAQLLLDRERGQAGVPPQPVRRRARRTDRRATARSSSSTTRDSGRRIGRTVISTVPTVLQRQGIFTEAIAGRVPVIYDPATTAGTQRGHAVCRQRDSRGPHRSRGARAAAALPAADVGGHGEQLPADGARDPTTRTSGPCALDHRSAADAISVFGRLTNFRGTFVPVTPLPEGSGVTTGTLGPQDTASWAFASNYQRTLSANLLNEVRIGDTRRTVDRTAAQLATSAGAALDIPGIPSTARFPEHAADVSDRRLPAARLAAEHGQSSFSTSVTEVADTLTWVEGPAHARRWASTGAGSG